MMHTGSISFKSGKMSDVVKWIYKMFLVHRACVIDRTFDGSGWRYLIKAPHRTMTLFISVIDGGMTADITLHRNIVPINVLGSTEVEYIAASS